MKTVILCGGKGTRLGEHGKSIPKALIKIGDKPILWHLFQLYAKQQHKEFILCLGHLGSLIEEYFTLNPIENCKVEFVDTGQDTNTGGRIKQVERFVKSEQSFFVTYGDGLANLNLSRLLEFHKTHGRIATLTAVHPVSNFGLLRLDQNCVVKEFIEKPVIKDWVNGGFFVFNREIFDYLSEDSTLERKPFEELSKRGELMAFQHPGFWKCMDTYKDNVEFNDYWNRGEIPWAI